MSKKNAGKIFEDNWKDSYGKLPIYYLRLKDAAKWQRLEGSSFTPENPYDALQYKLPFIWLLELKSTIGTSISFNSNKPYEKPEDKKTQGSIKAHQVKSLMEAVKTEGVIAGYIVNFRMKAAKMRIPEQPEATYFIHINDFIKFAEESGKSSMNRMDCAEIGIRIDSKLKKVNYTYDIKSFTEYSPKVYLQRGYINKESLIQSRDWINELII